MSKKGFTLIELLVVISIISLISSVILASLNSTREKARIAAGLSLAANLYRGYGADSNGVWNLDEGSGSVAYNKGGNSTNGTIVNATWINTGPNNKPALSFTTGRRIDLGTIATPTNVTVAAWVRTTSGGQIPVFSNRGTGLYFGITGGKFFAYYNAASISSMVSNQLINDGKWHHVVWTSDGTKGKMYIDGKFDSDLTQTRMTESAAAYIGFDAPNGEYFIGDIAQVAVYTQTLAAHEVENLYAQESVLHLAQQ
jgi:trimeric autotransporter adhesin